MSIPRPGSKVRGSQTGSPINALFDLLGRRWALGVIWNLADGPCSFRELQARCEGISPSILNSRIKDLHEAAVLDKTPEGYVLSDRGQKLRSLIVPLGQWAWDWSKEIFDFEKPGMKTKLEAEQSEAEDEH